MKNIYSFVYMRLTDITTFKEWNIKRLP